jgi:5'-3' exonuclease
MNIIIDGNAFLNVVTSIVKNILLKDKRVGEKYYVSDLLSDNEFILKQASKDAFRSFSLNYLGSIFAPFKDNISSVFFVFDSKSWRKKFIKDHFAEHGSGDFNYKGQRKYDDKIYLFFDYFQSEILPDLCDGYGILVNRVQGAEGDDLIAYICENLEEDICIWSVDKDLTQLLESSRRKVILLMPKMMTKYKKLYTTEDFTFEATSAETDLFNFETTSIDNSTLSNVVDDLLRKDYQHLRVDPTLDILTKVISGDSSDNIPRAHPKLTASKVSKVIENLKEKFKWSEIKSKIDQNDQDFSKHLIDVICETVKVSDPGEAQEIRTNISRNKSIIRLKSEFFPTEIRDAISSSVKLENRRRFNYFKFKKNYKNY